MQTKLIEITRALNSQNTEDITDEISDLLGEGWVVQSIAGGSAMAVPAIAGVAYTQTQHRVSWLVLLTKADE